MCSPEAQPRRPGSVRQAVGVRRRNARVFAVLVYTYGERYNSVMARRTSTDIEREAAEALANALEGLGIAVAVSYGTNDRGLSGSDLIVDVAGRLFDAEVKTVVTAAHGDQLARSLRGRPQASDHAGAADRL